MLKRDHHGGAATGAVLPLLFLFWVTLCFGDIEPGCLQVMGITGLAWEEMPVHVGHLVAEEFVVHFARLNDGMDGLGHGVDFIHEGMPQVWGEIKQFRDMPPGGDDAVAIVVLPGTEEGDGLFKFPDEFVGMVELGVFDLFAQRAGWFGGHWIYLDGSRKRW